MTNPSILINGACDPRFAAVREEFERSLPDVVVLSAKDFPIDLEKKGLGVVMAN